MTNDPFKPRPTVSVADLLDRTPLDADWLRKFGFREEDEEDEYFNIIHYGQLSVCTDDIHGLVSWCMRGQALLTEVTTRGQALMLLVGLNLCLLRRT